ncbi:uncharacterized protein BDCG_07076 [Blastomyces dermatitidis ER-3]|uniref:Uncharacterized protein n=1 Tax=Ajellomyces dermatitidis (strain ER-3 / ATCC MYA-2586) TaxID=559297 RepID=A0ABP2F643_AJEDR|nr:uncharacterized protein BDCG_07076 [Blastomyces dermatitidis ER-3]EEQ91956.2 hypothetical protein BDCG_07076 [Blastomyces dermatitidis ER-3]
MSTTTPPNQDPPPTPAAAAALPSSSSSSSGPAITTTSPPLPSPEQNIPTTTAPPPSSTTTTKTTSASPSPYQAFHTYPFATDAEFKLGLGVILGKPAGTPATEDEVTGTRTGDGDGDGGDGDGDEYAALGGELLLKAKMFYFAKKFPSTTTTPLTPKGYITYLQQLKNNPNPNPPSSSSLPPQSLPPSSAPPPPPSSTTTTTATPPQPHREPTYPTPFAHIVNLITTNQPIPGIQEIPDTVLTGKDKPSVAARRRKPWEVATAANASDAPDDGADGGSTSIEGGGDGAGVGKEKEKEKEDKGGEVEEQQQQLQ